MWGGDVNHIMKNSSWESILHYFDGFRNSSCWFSYIRDSNISLNLMRGSFDQNSFQFNLLWFNLPLCALILPWSCSCPQPWSHRWFLLSFLTALWLLLSWWIYQPYFVVHNQMCGLRYQLIWYALAATSHVVVQLMHYFDHNSASVHVSNRLLQSILLAVTNMIYIFK